MQTKSISQAIRTKMNEWIESVNDTELRNDLKKCLLVSGGAITSLYMGEPVNDFDVYLTDRAVLLNLVQYYCKAFLDDGVEILDGHQRHEYIDRYRGDFSMEDFLKRPGHRASSLRNLRDDQIKIYLKNGGGYKVELPIEHPKYAVSYISPNAISLTDQVQIVIRFWGTPDEVHKTFDFVHATNYFMMDKGVVNNKEALESLLTKTLRYQGSFYPLTSIIRAKKFVKRGFNINAGELLKIMYQLSLLDLNNLDVLEEQLIGIDVAYFEALIEALRKQQENNPDFKITIDYFNKLIDAIFNNSHDED